MGDPECQPILMRLDTDLYEYLLASYKGKLKDLPKLSWKQEYAVCVVLASKGYPKSYPKNDKITGFENIPENSFVFHAGTKKENESVLSNGGRVLGVTALGVTLQNAINNAYSTCEKLDWKNKSHRNDIGKKGLSYL